MTGSCGRCGCSIEIRANRRYCDDCGRHGTRKAERLEPDEGEELIRLYARLHEPMPRALIGRVLGISETRVIYIESRALRRAREEWARLYPDTPPFWMARE